MPDIGRFVIVGINRYIKTVGVEAEVFGQKFPGVGDRFFFEIIAEREVAEHLEKGVMASGPTNVFQVVVFTASADTFL